MHAGIDPSRSPPLIALPARASLTSSRLRLLLPPRRLSARDWVGALALAWVVLLAIASLRLAADGPDWGIRLTAAPNGVGAIVAAVRGHAVGWQQGIRSGDHVLLVDDRDAGALVEHGLGAARRLVVATAPGRARVARRRG